MFTFIKKLPIFYYSSVLNLPIISGKEIYYADSHGGFHGDGETFLIISFKDNSIENKIENNSNWKRLPLEGDLNAIIYGSALQSFSQNALFMDNNGNSLIPPIKNGYYCLIDKNNKSNDAQINFFTDEVYSFNFILGIYDNDANQLYVVQLDT